VNFSSADLPKVLKNCAEEKANGNGKVGNDKVLAINENIIMLDRA